MVRQRLGPERHHLVGGRRTLPGPDDDTGRQGGRGERDSAQTRHAEFVESGASILPAFVRTFCFAVAALCLLAPVRPAADDIPTDVLVQALAKPDGSQFHLALRMPLSALPIFQLLTR